ncbi:MAG: Holliday junction resolvase RuvX [Candidatus Firestonebacteria bacterium]|nr:Holliday junction resolvase RuvX [Candidatus Firestonebacteria bacterium]
MGIDYGDKRIGVAITDELTGSAHPLKVIGNSLAIKEIKKLIAEYGNVEKLVIGMPYNLKDEVAFKAKQVLVWIEKLRAEISIPIVTWDERFSTSDAKDILIAADVSRKKRKEVIDKMAACIILQSYVDSRKGKISGEI